MTIEKAAPEPSKQAENDDLFHEKQSINLFLEGRPPKSNTASRGRRVYRDARAFLKNMSRSDAGYVRPSYDTSKPIQGGQHFMVDDDQISTITNGGTLVLEMQNAKLKIKKGDLVILDPDELQPVEAVVIRVEGKKVTVGSKPKKKQ